MKMYNKLVWESRRWFAGLTIAFLTGGLILTAAVIRLDFNVASHLCSLTTAKNDNVNIKTTPPQTTPTTTQLMAILHYATSKIVPQQSLGEIRVTFDVIQREHKNKGFNFLVFGLGHDSLMWDSFNSLGTTLFLEEDPKWVQTVLKDSPNLRAHHVNYRTQLQQADNLLSTYKSEPRCAPANVMPLRGNTKCQLALDNLPEEVYQKEWDLIMIDAPRGYYPEAPGRMAAIFSAAVMARERRGSGTTHVFLHDVDRRVEKMFAEEFLCRKFLVNAVGRLWHFEIPSAANVSHSADGEGGDSEAKVSHNFCYLKKG